MFETIQKLQGSQAKLKYQPEALKFETIQKLQGSQAKGRMQYAISSLRPYRNYKVLKHTAIFITVAF